MSVESVSALVGLAEQFGPFLFAILFILVVTRTAHQWYRESITRTPHANPAEVRTLRFYFILSVYCGIGAMVLSVGWWFYAQTRGMYYYQFSISELSDEDQIASQYFTKLTPMPAVAGAPQLHDMYFLIGQPEPFNKGQKFTVQYYKLPHATEANTGALVSPEDIVVTYSGNNSDAFKLVTEAGKPPTLELSEAKPGAAPNFLPLRDAARFAQAATPPPAAEIGAKH